MGTRVRAMVEAGVPAAVSGPAGDLNAVEAADDKVDELHAPVVAYLGRISEVGITKEQTNEPLGLLEAAGGIEAIGYAVETNLVTDGRRRLEAGIEVLPSTRTVIGRLTVEVVAAVDIAVGAVGRGSIEADIIEDLKRIYYYAKRAARVGVPNGWSPPSALRAIRRATR